MKSNKNKTKEKTTALKCNELEKKEIFTITEASKLMHISASTLREWIKEGVFETHKIGRKEVLLKSNINVYYNW